MKRLGLMLSILCIMFTNCFATDSVILDKIVLESSRYKLPEGVGDDTRITYYTGLDECVFNN